PGRITFIQSGIVQPKMADVYHLVIPQELRGEGKNFNLLIEVTLTFTSNTRSTRKGAHQYLAGWVEWRSSKYNEPLSTFRQRTVSILEEGESEEDQQQDHDSIKWVLRENKNWSPGIEISRNNSTAQKSWTILQPHQFAEEFGISIIGHQGWEKDISIGIPYSLCVSFEVLDAEMDIYNIMSEAQVVIEPEIEL
ncbi:MAG: hypothetical protein R2809_00005, partial [Flavobacteriales bacterium]